MAVPGRLAVSPASRLKVTHFGEARVSDGVRVECAVLEDGRRGYVMRSLRQAIGIRKNIPVPAFEEFLTKIAPKALSGNGNRVPLVEVVMPHGGTGLWLEAGVMTTIASGVIRSALNGTLPAGRRGMVEPCMAIMDALGHTGEVALIDEATGYQYAREPDALQDLISRLIGKSARTWERRFHPDYYSALCRLFGFTYGGKHRPLPSIIGKITEQHVYLTVFPREIVDEISYRREPSDQGRDRLLSLRKKRSRLGFCAVASEACAARSRGSSVSRRRSPPAICLRFAYRQQPGR